MRAAIYARFSTDQQRDTSIDDQVLAAQAIAQRLGAGVIALYSDMAVSGTRRDRVDFMRMLDDARERSFDVLLLWDLKRLSRGEDLPQLLAQLQFVGVRIVTCDGYDSSKDDADLRGWIDAMMGNRYLKELAKNVHRGLTGQFNRGLSAGGMPYGYRPITRELGQDLEIDPEAAEHVRWIYERFAQGWSPRRIAYDLNGRGIPAGRGGPWALSAIYGHPKYQTGILRNPIYVGQYIWNRSRWVKDPETGKRHRVERPPSEWMTEQRPQLRIVSDELWQATRTRIRHLPLKGGRPARTPLGGLIRCGECGGSIIAVSPRDFGCGRHKDRGPTVCSGVFVKRKVLEKRVLEIAQEELLSKRYEEELRTRVANMLSLHERKAKRSTQSMTRRAVALDREIANLVKAVAAAGWSTSLADQLRKAENERKELQAGLTKAAAPAIASTLVPRLLDKYRAMVTALPATLKRAPDEARQALRECLGEVRLVKDGTSIYAEVDALGVILTMVAGVGFSNKNHAPERQIRRHRVA